MPRIRRLEIKGFRAFGSQPQVLEFDGPMAVVWGPNSQGKTSLAEAIEFLLTGKTVRREFVASARREFAEALRNVHLPPNEEVFVSAEIEDAAGQGHRVRRLLVRDYTGRDPCQSQLTIDGNPADDLTGLGIRLSQPPLEAPILMPHTLRYVVSAEPQERTAYFKALLEVSDLEEICAAMNDAKNRVQPPPNPLEPAYSQCRANPPFADLLSGLETSAPSRSAVTDALSDALTSILPREEPPPSNLDGRLERARQLLEERRGATFPLKALEPGAASLDTQPLDSEWKALEEFAQLKASVSREVARLTSPAVAPGRARCAHTPRPARRRRFELPLPVTLIARAFGLPPPYPPPPPIPQG